MSEYSKLERHHNTYEMRSVTSIDYKGFKIAIAEGGPKFVYTQEVTRQDCPNGYYDVMFTIMANERVIVERPIYFDTLHDIEKGYTKNMQAQGRINEAIAEAKGVINVLLKGYDA